MGALLGLARGIDRVNTLIGRLVGWAILVAILVSAANAIIRKLLNTALGDWIYRNIAEVRPSNALLELQWYLYGAAFLGAAAYTLLQNEHIRIDILYGHWSRRTQHWIDLVGHVFFLMPFVLLMIWLLVPFVQRSYRSGEVSMNAGGLPLWPAKSMLLVAFVMLAFQGLSEIIKKIAVMRGLIDDPTPFVSHHEAAELDGAALASGLAPDTAGPADPAHPLADLAVDHPRHPDNPPPNGGATIRRADDRNGRRGPGA